MGCFTMKTGHIKKRNMVMQAVLAFITLGVYVVYWYYVTLKELHIANGKDEGAVMWTVFLFLPILPVFAFWHYSSEYKAFSTEKHSTLLLFIAWAVFLPIVWYLVQSDLNKAADRAAGE